MFSSAKKKMVDRALLEQQDRIAQQKEMAKRQKRKNIDPEQLYAYVSALVMMKDMENSLYLRCAQSCTKLDDYLLSEGERDCLRQCNSKIQKYMVIAKNQFKNTQDDIKQATLFNSSLL